MLRATLLLGIVSAGLVGWISATFAQSVQAIGNVNILPNPNPSGSWTVNEFLAIGATGPGALEIRNGGTVTQGNGGTQIGRFGTGKMLVSGPGSRFDSSSVLSVGSLSKGELTIEDGGAVVVRSVTVSTTSAADGSSLLVTGPGSSLTAEQYNSGLNWLHHGSATVADGGKISTAAVHARGYSDRLTVTGAGSLWINSGTFYVGYTDTTGNTGPIDTTKLAVSGGGRVQSSEIVIAEMTESQDPTQSLGALIIGADTGQVAVSAGAIDTPIIRAGGGLASIVLNHTGMPDGSAFTLASSLVGNIALQQLSGTSVLTNDNAGFTGTVAIEGGTLQLGDGGTSGMIAGDIAVGPAANLVFDRSNDAVFAGQISGVGGALYKQGTGTLLLSGDSSAYEGTSFVNGGRLVVNGSLGGNEHGLIMVDGILAGTGSVGTTMINAGGTLAPGNSIGTLRFANGLSFAANSFYAVEVKAGGNTAGLHNDLAEVSGEVNIDSLARVQVRAENGTDTGASYAPDTTYTIITATGGVNGIFDGTVDANFAFLDASLGYDPDKVYLTLRRNYLTFASVGQTTNQKGAAGALSGFGIGDPIYQQIVGLSAEGAQRAFDLASGEVHASGQHLVEQSFAMFAGSLGRGRGRGVVIAAGSGAVAPPAYGPSADTAVASLLAVDAALAATRPVHSMWLAPLAGRGTIEADGNGAQLDWQSGGLAGGYEVTTSLASGQARFGLGLGYLKSDASIPDRLSSLTAEGGYAGIYGDWTDGAWSLAASLAYGVSRMNSHRDVVIGTLDGKAEAGYWTHSAGVSLEAAYGFELSDGLRVSPTGTLDVARSGHGGASETGAGALNANVDPAGVWRIDTGLGLNLDYVFALDSGSLTLNARALWEHGFGDTRPQQILALAGSGAPFAVAGVEAGRDRLRLGAGVSWSPSQATTLGLDYAATFANNQTSQGMRASVKVGF